MNTNTLAAAVTGFLVGGLTVLIAAELGDDNSPAPTTTPAATRAWTGEIMPRGLYAPAPSRRKPPFRCGGLRFA